MEMLPVLTLLSVTPKLVAVLNVSLRSLIVLSVLLFLFSGLFQQEDPTLNPKSQSIC